MITKPNDFVDNRMLYNNKKNQIGRRFKLIFERLTSTNYYEGTKYAEVFNQLNEDGTSKIYVYDPLEKELDNVINSGKNEIKYLVGLTGMGKTTLLKNYFKISNRDVRIDENKIIIYISFFYANLLSDTPQYSVNKEIIKYFSRTIKLLFENNSVNININNNFWEGFYDFILKNKPTMFENEPLLPNFPIFNNSSDNTSYDQKIESLNSILENDPLDYYSSLLKYILQKTKKPYTVVVVLDDIESKEEKFHKPVVESARHLNSCFTAMESKLVFFKTIVSLRAYTFRCNIDRQLEARRELLNSSVILKKQTVTLHDIFEKRFSAYEQLLKTENDAKNIRSYNYAKQQMQLVEKQLDRIASNLICNLANLDLTDALVSYCKVLTNLEWISCDEKEYNGAFSIDAENYRITTENVINALANENYYYYNGTNGLIPNILKNDLDGTTLISLYVIQSLIVEKTDEVYGEQHIDGNNLLDKIRNLYVFSTDNKTRLDYWEQKINEVLNHLYNAGILLRSIYDIEDPNDCQIERTYSPDYKLFLSPRGKCLFDLLSKNAVLLELYRDDIYTGLENNNKLTYDLSMYETFNYLLDYIKECFNTETNNIGEMIPDLRNYQETVGCVFLSSRLLEGVLKNIHSYYQNTEDQSLTVLVEKSKQICDEMKSYAQEINQRYNISFSVASYLSDETSFNI